MKDSKSLLLLVVSVLLILVSCALLWTWGFNFGNFAKEKQNTVFVVKDSTVATNATRDSLKKVYETTISNISKFDSAWNSADSLKDSLDLRLSEFYKLRNEIAIILKNPVKKEDLDLAKLKIGDLQKKIDQLRNKTADVESENKKLNEILQQLQQQPGNSNDNTQQTVKPAAPDNKQLVGYNSSVPNNTSSQTSMPVSNFSASDMRLTAIAVEPDKEQETSQASEADKFVGSFNVKNNLNQFNSTEIVVVIVQPDNKVMQASSWETGRFETKEGTKVYSLKVKFEYIKGENKHLSFSLINDKFQKGTYTLQLYYNGNLIGKTTKALM